jgi:hypothetical protein
MWKRSDAGAPQFVDEQHCQPVLLLIVLGDSKSEVGAGARSVCIAGV